MNLQCMHVSKLQHFEQKQEGRSQSAVCGWSDFHCFMTNRCSVNRTDQQMLQSPCSTSSYVQNYWVYSISSIHLKQACPYIILFSLFSSISCVLVCCEIFIFGFSVHEFLLVLLFLSFSSSSLSRVAQHSSQVLFISKKQKHSPSHLS